MGTIRTRHTSPALLLPLLLGLGACTNYPSTWGQGESPKSAQVAVTTEDGHVSVRLPRCPDWSAPDAASFSNGPDSNFGCATATNLALMAAFPRDLAQGAPSGGADATFAARGVELYRAGALSKSLSAASGQNGGGNGQSGGAAGTGAPPPSGGGGS
jgi:pilus assembly protein CpaD